ncbi:O-antigen ligase [Halorhodospira sp. 9622]|uniref:O-antigen ligase family protein n=1 Tax=Halorhodospira sp. 9622 TaxID=2899136 RepID=UPI001EE8CC92|nr:O-antigen ligase family protein [Halorhodospira sp. 9622]MCG5539061.1 O-antigen ligase family protein [Halorhodospira sp. 9622]
MEIGSIKRLSFIHRAHTYVTQAPTDRRWVNLVGSLGVVAASSSFLLERDVMRAGELLMFVALLAALPAAWRFFRTNPAFWLFLIWVAALALSNSLVMADPAIPTDHNIWNAARHWSRVGWIPLMAWLIAGRLGIVKTVFFCYTAAWFAATLPELSPDLLRASLEGARLDFGTGNPHRAALPFMITTLILGFLARDWVGPGPRVQSTFLFLTRLTLWGLALAYSTFGLFSAQGAGPVGGAVTASLIGLFVLWRHLTEGKPLFVKLRLLAVGAGALVVIAAGLAIAFKPAIDSRLATFSGGLSELSEGEIVSEGGTVGARYYLWTFAFEKWAERPLTGYGTESAQSLIPVSELPERTRQFNHLHNSFLELTFSTGLLGAAILLVFFAHISQKVIRSVKEKKTPKRYGTLYFGLLIAFILANSGESYIVFSHFWPHLALISAGFYSLALFSRPRRSTNAHHTCYSPEHAAGKPS